MAAFCLKRDGAAARLFRMAVQQALQWCRRQQSRLGCHIIAKN